MKSRRSKFGSRIGGGRIGSLVAVVLLVAVAASGRAADAPDRETLEHGGWTISFAREDRAVAEALTNHLAAFEQRYVAVESAKASFGPIEVEAASADWARRAADWSGLPDRAAEFQRAVVEAARQVEELQGRINSGLCVRAIELWRREDAQLHLVQNKKYPGVAWNEDENRLGMSFTIRISAGSRAHPSITMKLQAPTTVMLLVPENVDPEAATAMLVGEFDGWVKTIEGLPVAMVPGMMRLALSAALASVISPEVAPDGSTEWIRVGLSGWLWREIVFTTLPPETAKAHAAAVPALAVPGANRPPVNLETWPPTGGDDNHADHALQLFCNLAERHGAEAIPRLMAEFWQLPRDQRTSAGLKMVYRQLMGEPLEARAPWRSLGSGSEWSSGSDPSA